MEITSSPWIEFKVKVLRRFGTLRAAATHFHCTEEALRQAVLGTNCGKVRARLQKAGLLED